MPWDHVVRHLAVVRDVSAAPERRALAAASLAASDGGSAAAPDDSAVDPALRMFGFFTTHGDAAWWDGRGSRSGTITLVDAERIEQYVGARRWVAYRRAEFAGGELPAVGDQVRIAKGADGLALETIGPNRLASSAERVARDVCSGMFVLRSTESAPETIEAVGQIIAERYGGGVRSDAGAVALDFRGGGAQLTLTIADSTAFGWAGESLLMQAPVVSVVRLDIAIRSTKPEAALEAERALILSAAMLAAEAEAIAIDDSRAIFSADGLYALAARNAMRADAHSFVAAAVRRYLFSPHAPLRGPYELTVFSSRPWRADFAATFLARELRALTEAASETADPNGSARWEISAAGEREDEGALEGLARVAFDLAEIEVMFIDVERAPADLRSQLAARRDIDALLGAPIASAVVVAFDNRSGEPDDADVQRDLRRADGLATTLAAIVARRADSIAIDAAGTVYSATELLELALRRSGAASSWNARVTACTVGERPPTGA